MSSVRFRDGAESSALNVAEPGRERAQPANYGAECLDYPSEACAAGSARYSEAAAVADGYWIAVTFDYSVSSAEHSEGSVVSVGESLACLTVEAAAVGSGSAVASPSGSAP